MNPRGKTLQLMLATALGLGLGLAPSASAGTYEVLVCDAAAGIGGDNMALSLGTDEGTMWNETHCPSDDAWPDGVIHRNRLNQGNANFLRGAHGTFFAPAGTIVRDVLWRGGMQRGHCSWSMGFTVNNQLTFGIPANVDCGVPGFIYPETLIAINAPWFQTSVRCGSLSGCDTTFMHSGGWNGYAAVMWTTSMRIRVDDPTPPAISNLGGALVGGNWVRGSQNVTFDATDGAGIVSTRLRVAGEPRDQAVRSCDYRLAAPCSSVGGGGYTFNTAGLADGEHPVVIEATDPGQNTGSASATLRSDNTAPARPTALTVEGGDGWRATNAFDLSWTNPGGQFAPIVAAYYSICPAGQLERCSTGSARGNGITRLTGVRVPEAGDWTLRMWLEDAAGNVDPKTASDPVHLRFDNVAPQVTFLPQDPSDPRRVSAAVSDQAAGVATGAIELSREGSGSWQTLATSLENGQLVAYIDDEGRTDGRYLLRAQASDHAGNRGLGDRMADGTIASVTLPVRGASVLRIGVPKRVRVFSHARGKRRVVTKLIGRKRIRYGHSADIEGRLTNRDGQPVAGQQLMVYGRTGLPKEEFQPLGSVTTNDRGWFRYRARGLFNIRVRIHYPGTASVRPTSDDAVLLVPARVTLRANPRRIHKGQRVVFAGRFNAPQEKFRSGKLVELQAKVRRGWRTFATDHTDAKGRYAAPFRFIETTRDATYTFRARVPHDKGYPYEAGVSRYVRVTVLLR